MNASLEMTIQDWFAGLAMQAFIESTTFIDGLNNEVTSQSPDELASMSYEYADAMLAERNKDEH